MGFFCLPHHSESKLLQINFVTNLNFGKPNGLSNLQNFEGFKVTIKEIEIECNRAFFLMYDDVRPSDLSFVNPSIHLLLNKTCYRNKQSIYNGSFIDFCNQMKPNLKGSLVEINTVNEHNCHLNHLIHTLTEKEKNVIVKSFSKIVDSTLSSLYHPKPSQSIFESYCSFIKNKITHLDLSHQLPEKQKTSKTKI